MNDEPPIPLAELKSLFDYLDRPDPSPCTHTFRETRTFLQTRRLPIDSTLAWLGRNGAGCDCEVIFNVEAQWGERVGRVPNDDDV